MGCQSQLDIGDRFHAMMCFMCTNHVTHLLRIARAFEDRTFRTWREDEWLRTVLESNRTGSALSDTENQAVIELQDFLVNSLRKELYVWADPPPATVPPPVTPTEGAGLSPFSLLGGPVQHTSRPPGLPTPRAEINAPQEFMQQGAAVNSGQDTGGTEVKG